MYFYLAMSITRMELFQLIFQQNILLVHGILGGYEISIDDAPYQVNYGDKCGGVIIHEKWALTSAHCGTDENFIRVGSRNRLRGTKMRIIYHKVHPSFGIKHTYDYDIQLLRLFKKLNFSKRIQAIEFSSTHDGHFLVSGWGYPEEKTDYTDVLHQVQLNLVPMRWCQEVNNRWYNHTLTERMFCAGGRGRDACQGDSGGAAVSLGRIVGLSSFGFGCGRDIPGVYINISNSDIREWIRGYTGV